MLPCPAALCPSRKIAIMPTRPSAATVTGARVYLRPPQATDAAAFIAAARASRRLHGAWTSPPATRSRFDLYVQRFAAAPRRPRMQASSCSAARTMRWSACSTSRRSSAALFRSTYLGYYGFAPHAGQGYMTEGMALALDVAFRKLGLHRVEVNIQPTNERSLALARAHRLHARRLFPALREDRRPLARSRALRDARRGVAGAARPPPARAAARDARRGQPPRAGAPGGLRGRDARRRRGAHGAGRRDRAVRSARGVRPAGRGRAPRLPLRIAGARDVQPLLPRRHRWCSRRCRART